jgi:hypothetical protein
MGRSRSEVDSGGGRFADVEAYGGSREDSTGEGAGTREGSGTRGTL